MTPAQFERIEELFHEFRRLSPERRQAALDAACGEDAELGDEVRKLLACDDPDRTLSGMRAEVFQPRHAASVPGLALPPDSFAGYEIIKEIHRGGQGVVYEALQRSTKRRVAIKVMKEGGFASHSDKARFEREVEILGQLNHPNIVSIHDTGDAAGHFYYVMDYISGQPLDAWVSSSQRSIEDALRLFQKICEAVNAAHLRGVIHRDIKPGNIRIDARGEPYILDFGLAKVVRGVEEASLMTVTGQFMGSLPWASPEQAEALPSKIDIRTDVYSLGVILYHMLTGKFPYEVIGNMRDVLDRIMRAEPVRPSAIRRQINDEVETIVLKCLSKERDRRYQTAGELARDIGHYLNAEPIEAKRESTLYLLRKALRKHKALFGGTAAVLAVLIAATVTSTVFYARARAQRTRAEQAATRFKAENLLLQDIVAALNPRSLRSQGPAIASAISAASQRLDEGLLSDDVDTEAKLRRLLGDVYYVFGEYDNAAWQWRKAISLLKGTDRVATADMFENVYSLACLAATQGQSREAMALLEGALPLSTEALGREDPRIVIAEGLLAMLRGDVAGTQAAVESYRRIAARHLKDPNLPDVEKARHLAFVVEMSLDTGRPSEVEVYGRELLALDRRVYGERHVYVAYASKSLALSLEAQGRFAEAEELLRQALDIEIEVLHERAPEVGRTLANIGRVAAKQGRLADAENALREALQILDVRSPEIWLRYDARSTLGGVLSDQGKFGEAELLLLPSYEELAGDPLTWPDRKRDALQRIVRLYEAWGRPEQATDWRTRLARLAPAASAPHEMTGDAVGESQPSSDWHR